MTSARLALALFLTLGIASSACAPSVGDASERSRRGPITLEEIQRSGVTTTAYDLVQNLRPEWFHSRTGNPIRVYLDEVRYGDDARSLAGLSVQNIRRIERIDSGRATARFGTGHLEGAFLVTSR
jgi:hypothetical protein